MDQALDVIRKKYTDGQRQCEEAAEDVQDLKDALLNRPRATRAVQTLLLGLKYDMQ